MCFLYFYNKPRFWISTRHEHNKINISIRLTWIYSTGVRWDKYSNTLDMDMVLLMVTLLLQCGDADHNQCLLVILLDTGGGVTPLDMETEHLHMETLKLGRFSQNNCHSGLCKSFIKHFTLT